MRHADDRALDHPRQRVDRLLDLLGIDVEPAGDDQILRPPDDGDVAVRLDPRHVAGDEEPVRPHLLRRLLRQPPVAREDVRPAHLQHPHLARRQLAARPARRPGARPPAAPAPPSPPAARRPAGSRRSSRSRSSRSARGSAARSAPRTPACVAASSGAEPEMKSRIPAAAVARQRRAGEEPGVEGRHPHQHRRPRASAGSPAPARTSAAGSSARRSAASGSAPRRARGCG